MCERYSLEREINVTLNYKGQMVTMPDGSKMIMNPENVLSIFKKIPGSPMYWRQYRQELFAKMKQLGPFDLFWTVSCGEPEWAEEIAAILKKLGHDVRYVNETWKGSEEEILIDGTPFPEFKENHLKSGFT